MYSMTMRLFAEWIDERMNLVHAKNALISLKTKPILMNNYTNFNKTT